MPPRPQIAWFPLLLGLYLLGIIAYVVATRWTTLLAAHPAYPVTLMIVGVGALLAVIVALVRSGCR